MPRSKSPALSLEKIAELAKAELAALQVNYGLAIEHAVKAGELLAQAKSMCKHGEWLPWLRANFELSDRTAQRYMLIAQEIGRDPSRVADLTVRAVRKGLAPPAPPKPRQPEIPADSDMGKLLAKATSATAAQRELPPPASESSSSAEDEEPIIDAEVVDDPDEPGDVAGADEGFAKPLGSKSSDALAWIRQEPGISIPELAARMGIKQNYLYRVLPGLEQEGRIEKQGRGWHPKGDDTAAASTSQEPPASTPAAGPAPAPVPPAAPSSSEPAGDSDPQADPEIPSALTVAEERKFLAIVTQIKDALNLLHEAAEEGLSAEATANALRDAGHASRRAAVNLEELAGAVEKRA